MFLKIYSQRCIYEPFLWIFEILQRSVPPLLHLLLCDPVPDFRVDPQGAGQGEAGPGAGNPAAQGAGDAADDTLDLAHSLQAGCAEGVAAVEDPGDPVAA